MDRARLRRQAIEDLESAAPWTHEHYSCWHCGWVILVVRQIGRPVGQFACDHCGAREVELTDARGHPPRVLN